MVKKCIIQGCKSDSRRKFLSPDIKFLAFPKFKSRPQTARRWAYLCGIPEEKISRHSYICSVHFPKEHTEEFCLKLNPDLEPFNLREEEEDLETTDTADEATEEEEDPIHVEDGVDLVPVKECVEEEDGCQGVHGTGRMLQMAMYYNSIWKSIRIYHRCNIIALERIMLLFSFIFLYRQKDTPILKNRSPSFHIFSQFLFCLFLPSSVHDSDGPRAVPAARVSIKV